MPALSNRDVQQEVQDIVKVWEDEQAVHTNDPTPHLVHLCEIFEREYQNFLKQDPDPFDDRHPVTQKPDCALGLCLRALLKKDSFISKLVNHYTKDNYFSGVGVNQDATQLNTAACRLLLDLLSGLDIPQAFRDAESTVQRLYIWAEKADEPLRTYAIGLLAAAMEIPDFPTTFREQNSKLIPMMLERLWELKEQNDVSLNGSRLATIPERPFAGIGKVDGLASPEVAGMSEPASKRMRPSSMSPDHEMMDSDCSSSSWAEMGPYIMGCYQVFPLEKHTTEMFILKYLRPVSEYQESLTHIYKHNAMDLVFHYINVRAINHSRLSFEALRFLGSLLFHKKFCLQFVCAREANSKITGIHKLLQVPRPSLAADGVALCLWYLAFSEEAIEKICQQSQTFISKFVSYGLWLLECSHQSSRTHAVMFFGLVFKYKPILEKFDQKGGLRILVNMLSTLSFIQGDDPDYNDEPTIMWQTIKHVCASIKSYFEAHLYIKVETVSQSVSQTSGTDTQSLKSSKPMYSESFNDYSVVKNVDYLLEKVTARTRWQAVDNFVSLKGIQLLVQLLHAILEEPLSLYRSDAAVFALECLHICSVMPKVQSLLCEKVTSTPHNNDDDVIELMEITGCNVIMCGLTNTEGYAPSDSIEIQKASLKVLINCLCAPLDKNNIGPPGSQKKKYYYLNEEILMKTWDSVRSTNGIMNLINILSKKSPITDADLMRAGACRALVGLARSDIARQIMSKLPIFTSGQLHMLMKEPILQEKRAEFVAFQKNALELTKLVVGLSEDNNATTDGSIPSIKKAELVSKTRTNYNKQQLMQLMQSFLIQEGYEDVASHLQREANLPPLPPYLAGSMGPPMHAITTPTSSRIRTSSRQPSISSSSPALNGEDIPSTPPNSKTPLQLKLNKHRKICNRSPCPTTPPPGGSFSKIEKFSTQAFANNAMPAKQEPRVSLEKIVQEYLLSQHALCKNPVITCPPFDLLKPHRCPDPKPSRPTSMNFTTRYLSLPYNKTKSRDLFRKFVYSRYRPAHVFKPAEDATFVCCAFMPDEANVAVGTLRGEVQIYNKNTDTTILGESAGTDMINGLVPHKSGSLLLASSGFGAGSTLWSVSDILESKHVFNESYGEFNNAADKVVTTTLFTAKLYDLNSCQVIREFSPESSNHYSLNRASLDPTDDLLLSDGVLFDVRSGKQIHKFDKFNDMLSGQFHRNGLEVITSGEIWDLRTFHLLRTVPMLAECSVLFNHSEDVIFGTKIPKTFEEMEPNTQYPTSFTVLNSHDYSNITTVDVKKVVCCLDINKTDTQLALIEGEMNYLDEYENGSFVKIYDIGMTRQEEDEPIDEDDDEEDTDSDEDDNSDDSDADSTAEDDGDGLEILSVDLASSSDDNADVVSYDEQAGDQEQDEEMLDNSQQNVVEGEEEEDQWEDEEEVIEIGDDDDDYDDDVIIEEDPL